MLALAGAGGQTLFDQAPPTVDAALRSRVREFYQLQLDGKWEAAVKLAAEDSRELLQKMERRSFKKFETEQITWESNFTEAKVLTNLDVSQPQGFPFPELTFWKLEKGVWVWWLPPSLRKKG